MAKTRIMIVDEKTEELEEVKMRLRDIEPGKAFRFPEDGTLEEALNKGAVYLVFRDKNRPEKNDDGKVQIISIRFDQGLTRDGDRTVIPHDIDIEVHVAEMVKKVRPTT